MMPTRLTTLLRHTLLASALGACLMAPAAHATTDTDASARYKQDVARCNAGQTSQDKATCLREAGAAYQEAQRQRLMNKNQNYSTNQIQRCEALPAAERDDCLLQMSGQNTSTQNTVTQGSVSGGGVLRETTITIPATPEPAATSQPGLMPAVPSPVQTPGTQ